MACVWTNCRSTFATFAWLRYLQNMHSERINRFFRCRKTLTFHFIFYVREEKEVIRFQVRTKRRMTHQIYDLSAQKMQLFVAMCESSYCRSEEWSVFGGWFSWFFGQQLANKWLCITQNWLFCVGLMVRLRHIQFFWKNRRLIALKCFVPEQLLLNLAHLETPIQPTAVYFRAYARKSTIHHLSQCHRSVSKHRDRIFGAFLSTNRHEPFFERFVNCVGSNANKFFWQPNVHAIWNVC